MLPNAKERLARTVESLPEPHALEPWFQDLPPQQRAEMTRDYRNAIERGIEIGADEQRRKLRETLSVAAIYFVGDLACVHGGWGKVLLATLLGSALGWALHRIDAHRLLSGGLGLGLYFVFESLANGFAGLHLLAAFPLGAACAYVGYRREERGLG